MRSNFSFILQQSVSFVTFGAALRCSALLALAAGGWMADASIVSTTGAVVIIPAPASVVPGASVNRADGQAFDERQGVTLAGALAVNAINPGTYKNGSGPGGTIAAGSDVSSYFVLFDSGGASDTYPTATLTFSSKILGVIFGDADLNKSDPILGDPGTKYPTGLGDRGQEGGDSTEISADGFSVTLKDTTAYPGDDIRIITAEQPLASPEPVTLALMGVGMAAVGLWRRGAKRGGEPKITTESGKI